MVTNKVRNRINNLIDGQIRALEKEKECESDQCSCCGSVEIDEDIESLNKLKDYIKKFK